MGVGGIGRILDVEGLVGERMGCCRSLDSCGVCQRISDWILADIRILDSMRPKEDRLVNCDH